MASQCPKCKQTLDDDIICCAELKQTWKCKSCGKLSVGFVVPYGRCFMCTGELEIVEGYTSEDPAKTKVIEEAVRYEVEMYQFYRLAKARTSDAALGEVLEEMYLKEVDHLEELGGILNQHGKEAVLEAAMRLAASDGSVDPAEIATIEQIGRALTMTDAHVRGVIETARDRS